MSLDHAVPSRERVPARPCPPARSGIPRRLSTSLWQVAGAGITHPWDGNAYLVDAGDPTLLDCGSAVGYPALRDALAFAGPGIHGVRRVLATHGHWDHVSAVAPLREEAEVELWAHAAERDALESGDPVRTTARLLYAQPAPRLRVDEELVDGDVLPAGAATVEVLHTPGHSPGSVSFVVCVDGYRLLVAGDTLWGGFHPAIGSDIEEWRRSLDRLLELDLDYMTFGHCVHDLVPDVHARLLEARSRLGSFYDPWFRPPYLALDY